VSGPSAGDRFGPDGVTEEQVLVDALEWEALRGVVTDLRDEVGQLRAVPVRASQRKVVVACVALVSSAVVSIVLVTLGDADAGAVMTSYGAIVSAALAVFAAGNAAEHATRANARQAPYSPPPPSWRPR